MTQEPMLQFEEHGRITVAAIVSASVLDALNVNHFGEEARQYLVEHKGANLLLDFSRVNYLSSAVLTELLRLKDLAEADGGAVRLCALNDDIRTVFEITNLNKVFTIYKTREAGMESFERSLARAAESKAWDDI